MDKSGTVVGKAERWEEPEAQEPEKEDLSALAGCRVNKNGFVADANGQLIGRVSEGDVKKLISKMCDKEGQIWSEGGEVIGRAELLPESERQDQRDAPFADYQPATANKDGKVYDSQGTVVGKIVEVCSPKPVYFGRDFQLTVQYREMHRNCTRKQSTRMATLLTVTGTRLAQQSAMTRKSRKKSLTPLPGSRSITRAKSSTQMAILLLSLPKARSLGAATRKLITMVMLSMARAKRELVIALT